jgi:hypothetical protein
MLVYIYGCRSKLNHHLKEKREKESAISIFLLYFLRFRPTRLQCIWAIEYGASPPWEDTRTVNNNLNSHRSSDLTGPDRYSSYNSNRYNKSTTKEMIRTRAILQVEQQHQRNSTAQYLSMWLPRCHHPPRPLPPCSPIHPPLAATLLRSRSTRMRIIFKCNTEYSASRRSWS